MVVQTDALVCLYAYHDHIWLASCDYVMQVRHVHAFMIQNSLGIDYPDVT